MFIITFGPFSAIMVIRLKGDVGGRYDGLTFDSTDMGRCIKILMRVAVITN